VNDDEVNMDPLYISTGKVADGRDRYFGREKIENRIISKIRQKENILLAAHRKRSSFCS
jgi:hypothetical protein